MGYQVEQEKYWNWWERRGHNWIKHPDGERQRDSSKRSNLDRKRKLPCPCRCSCVTLMASNIMLSFQSNFKIAKLHLPRIETQICNNKWRFSFKIWKLPSPYAQRVAVDELWYYWIPFPKISKRCCFFLSDEQFTKYLTIQGLSRYIGCVFIFSMR